MSARSPLPSTVPATVRRIAPLVDALAVLAGVVGSLTLLGDRGALPAAVDRLHAVVAVGRAVPPYAPLARPLAWAVLVLGCSLLAGYALWSRRRWLVWSLAGTAAVVAVLTPTAGGVAVAPFALLLSVAAGLRSFRAGRTTAEQPDVTL
ncbi:hypothetical protein EI982_07655 [Haloplanus rallus]|jgi:hypothetical protein|uniref:Uncharacterized protein n=1 Tax=Haloplanus rallus TaxID=1816183 RepID=A0A6B9F8F9_9EURY|nr:MULTISPECIES: hypothetical protein [Haloplanus]QGX94677.1 hypothetical protein EI982_07655 [Haloplanus rallus]